MEVANAISWVWTMICPGEEAHALEIPSREKHICEGAAGAMHIQLPKQAAVYSWGLQRYAKWSRSSPCFVWRLPQLCLA